MITDCAAHCGKKVIAENDNRAYLCRRCWKNLFDILLKVIRSAPEPPLQLVNHIQPTEKEVA